MEVKEVLIKDTIGNKTVTTFETIDGKYHTLVKEKDVPVHHYMFMCAYDYQSLALIGHEMCVRFFGNR